MLGKEAVEGTRNTARDWELEEGAGGVRGARGGCCRALQPPPAALHPPEAALSQPGSFSPVDRG